MLLLTVQACDKKATTNKPEKNNIEYANSSIETMIQNMSIEQKVGQMTQVNIDVISKGEVYNLDVPHEIDSAKLDIALNKYFVGSILNAAGYPFSRNQDLYKFLLIENNLRKLDMSLNFFKIKIFKFNFFNEYEKTIIDIKRPENCAITLPSATP